MSYDFLSYPKLKDMLLKQPILIFIIGALLGALGNYWFISGLHIDLYIKNLIWITILAGSLGGIVNYFFNQTNNEFKNDEIVKSIITGIVAAALVPLFLNMISSDLISSIRGVGNSSPDPYKYFVFFGFCLVAAVSSRAFIQNISDRLLKEIKNVKEIAENAKEEAEDAQEKATAVKNSVEPLVDKETETEDSNQLGESESKVKAQLEDLELFNKDRKVLEALVNTSYTYRSKSGIRNAIKEITLQEVGEALTRLVAHGLAKTREGERGIRWFATEKGRDLLSHKV